MFFIILPYFSNQNKNNTNNNININATESKSSSNNNYTVDPEFSPSVMKMRQSHEKNNNILDLIPLLYCIININSLKNFLISNKKEILSKNNISKEICEIIDKMKDDININNYINIDNFIQLIGPQKYFYDAKNLIIFLLRQMHNELNTKSINEPINNLDSNPTDLNIELNNMRNFFGTRNKSIISDTFYFEEIIMNQCPNHDILTCNCSMNNNFTFILDDVFNFKSNNIQ